MKIEELLKWSAEFKNLPWRQERSLYITLVSEIMLQQTTVSTVKNHFDKFLKTFPNLEKLANASEQEMLIAWKGLGYYRRARNLKKIAETLVKEYQGKFPDSIEKLQAIAGIGPYTANAIVGIGMNKRALAIDANLERVISRLYGIKVEKGLKLQKEIYKLFSEQKIFPQITSYRELNEALMDLGRTYCQARKASCELCPMRKDCVAFKEKESLKYPVEKETTKQKAIMHDLELLRVFVMRGEKLLTYKKENTEWLSGQYEVPTFILSSTDKNLKQYPLLTKKFKLKTEASYKTNITKYKIQNRIIVMDEKEFKTLNFDKKIEWKKLDSNLSTATIKGLKKTEIGK